MASAVARKLCLVFLAVALAAAQDIPNGFGGYSFPSWFAKALAATLMCVGLLECFAGYKLFRVTLFLLGFLGVGLAICVPIMQHLDSPNAPWIGLGVGGGIGLLVGILGLVKPKVGVALVGAAAGVVAAIFCNTAFGYKIPIDPRITLGIFGAVIGIVGAILALLLMRIVVIISTAVVGAFVAIYGMGKLIPPPNSFPDVFDLASQMTDGTHLPGFVYGYLAGFAVLAVIGTIVQFRFTAGKKAPAGEKDQWEKIVHEDGVFMRCVRRACSATARGIRSPAVPATPTFSPLSSLVSSNAGKKGAKDAAKGSAAAGKPKASQKLKEKALLADYKQEAAEQGSIVPASSAATPAYAAAPRFTREESEANPWRTGGFGAIAPSAAGGGSAADYAEDRGHGNKARNINW